MLLRGKNVKFKLNYLLYCDWGMFELAMLFIAICRLNRDLTLGYYLIIYFK